MWKMWVFYLGKSLCTSLSERPGRWAGAQRNRWSVTAPMGAKNRPKTLISLKTKTKQLTLSEFYSSIT